MGARIKAFVKLFRELGTVNTVADTVENELKEVGRLFEKARLEKVSLSKEVRDRYCEAIRWAAASNMSETAVNWFLREGGDIYRQGR